MKGRLAPELITALAKKAVADGKPKRADDYRTCAKAIMAAMKSGSEDDLASALRAYSEVSRDGGDSTE